jgi:hypothetical protein
MFIASPLARKAPSVLLPPLGTLKQSVFPPLQPGLGCGTVNVEEGVRPAVAPCTAFRAFAVLE